MNSPGELRATLQASLGTSYVIDRELGGGGMSRVFVARDAALGRDVVIKVLAPELAGDVSLDRFRREIELAARLQHPNIVPLHSAGEAGGLPYYTMPFIEGESLRTRLSRSGELPVPEVVAILRDVARALAYAHAHHVVHRDIKPDNVLLADDYAVVTDFGVAKALAAARNSESGNFITLTAQGVALGTPAYMAPEQVAADPNTDHRADIYAFGAMAYEMLAGTPPFSARTAQGMMAAHVSENPNPVETRRPAANPQLASLVMRCLAKRPADRPQQATDIVRELESAGTPPASLPPRMGSTARRRRLVAAAAIVCLAATATAIVARSHRTLSVALNRNVIAVLPFRIVAPDTLLNPWREGMLNLVEAKLNGNIRSASPRSVLAAWRAAGGGRATDIDDSASFRAMRQLGAGRLMMGDVTRIGGGITLHASLVDLAGPTLPISASATGVPDAIGALVDTVVAKLLIEQAGESKDVANRLAGIPFEALQAWTDGEAAFRAGAYARAADQFKHALSRDSTLAIAGLGLYEALSWSLGSDPAGTALGSKVAITNRAQLGMSDQFRLDELTSVQASAADRLTREASMAHAAGDEPAGWYYMGENLFHNGAEMGIEDALARARSAFNRALELDPSYTPALEHLPQINLLMGDTVAARHALSLFPAGSDDVAFNRYLVDADPAARRADIAELVRGQYPKTLAAVFNGACFGPGDGRELDSLVRGAMAAAVDERDRMVVRNTMANLALIRGQPRLADSLRVVSPNSAMGLSWYVLAALFSDGDSAHAANVLAEVRHAALSPDPTQRGVQVVSLFAVAESELRRDSSSSTVTEAIATLNAIHGGDAMAAHNLALLIDAQRAVAQHTPEARRLVEASDSMMKRVEPGPTESYGNLIVARMWRDLGEPQKALAAINRFPCLSGWQSASTYSRDRARYAEAAGDKSQAIDAWRRYIRMRAHPEPLLQKDLESSKEHLRALDGRG